MRKKLLVLVLVLVLSVGVLTACNNKDNKNKVTYGDIYAQNEGISPYTSTGIEVVLPSGIEPYYTLTSKAKVYSSTYNESTDVIFCQQTIDDVTKYGFYYVAGKNFIGDACAYADDFFVSYGLICACYADTGECVVYQPNRENAVIPKSAGIKVSVFDLEDVLIPLSKDYVAVKVNDTNYYNVYKVSDGKTVNDKDGAPIKVMGGDTIGLKVVDDYLVRTEYTGTTSTKKIKNVYVFDLKNYATKIYDAFYGFSNPTSSSSSLITTYPTRAFFYLGNGKAYCYNQETGDENAYQYKEVSEDGKTTTYYKIVLWYYDLVTGEKKDLLPTKIFTTIINSYYSQEVSRDVKSYINDGYSYVSTALIRGEDKTCTVEQYIIDSDMNTYVSLIDHSGSATKYDKESDESREVMLQFVDGYGFSNEATGDILIYDTLGNTVLRVEGTFSNVFYNNGIVTATKEVDNNDYYVAYRIDGTCIIDASRCYQDLCGTTYNSSRMAYVGKYTLAKDSKSNIYLVDNTGKEVQKITDMYMSGTQPYYYAGVYVSYTKSSSVNFYGLKTYDGTVLFDNQFTDVVLDKRGTNKIVFYANDGTNWKIYFIE